MAEAPFDLEQYKKSLDIEQEWGEKGFSTNERTGIRPPTVSAICTGAVKHLPVEALNKICEVLECQPSDLMEYVPDDVQ